jgi:hypothetical protein
MSYLEQTDRADIDAAIDDLNAGQSIEDMAEGVVEDDDSGQQLLDFGDSLNLSVKGKKPTDSEIKIKAISRPIKGQLGDSNDDEIVSFLVTGRLDEIRMVTKRDGDGRVAAKSRRHIVTPISVFPVTPAQADALLGLD